MNPSMTIRRHKFKNSQQVPVKMFSSRTFSRPITNNSVISPESLVTSRTQRTRSCWLSIKPNLAGKVSLVQTHLATYQLTKRMSSTVSYQLSQRKFTKRRSPKLTRTSFQQAIGSHFASSSPRTFSQRLTNHSCRETCAKPLRNYLMTTLSKPTLRKHC